MCARNRERSEKTRQEAGKRGAQVRWRSMSLKRAKRWNKKKKKKKKRETKTSRGSLHFNIPGPTPPLSFLFLLFLEPGTRPDWKTEKKKKTSTEHYAAPLLYIYKCMCVCRYFFSPLLFCNYYFVWYIRAVFFSCPLSS